MCKSGQYFIESHSIFYKVDSKHTLRCLRATYMPVYALKLSLCRGSFVDGDGNLSDSKINLSDWPHNLSNLHHNLSVPANNLSNYILLKATMNTKTA